MTDIDLIDEYKVDPSAPDDFEGETYRKMPNGLYLHPQPVRNVPSDRITFATYVIPIGSAAIPVRPIPVITRKEDGIGATVRLCRVDAGTNSRVFLFSNPDNYSVQVGAFAFCPYGYALFNSISAAGTGKTEIFTTRDEIWIAAVDATQTVDAIVSVAIETYDVG